MSDSLPRVIGGNYNGGTDCVVGCPRMVDDPERNMRERVRCDAEVEVSLSAGGLMTVADKECHSCLAVWSPAELTVMRDDAERVIDNYDPSEADLARMLGY